MKNKNNHSHIIEQVPLDYYQKGVRNNALQRAWHTRKLDVVISSVRKYPKTVLDVGCASGWFLSRVHKQFPKSKCVGVDIYKDAILYGKKKYPRINFRVSDAHTLPFKANSFDLVICTEVLEHVEDPLLVLKEIKRVLKIDGQVIIELDSGSVLFSVVWFLWGLSQGRVWNHSHLHSFNVQKLERMLKKCGFTIESKKRFNLGMAMVFSAIKHD